MIKFHLTIEFRHLFINSKIITIGVYDTLDDAIIAGNESLKVLEKRFTFKKKEKFSKNGGPFGRPNLLITDLGYLKTPFEFFARISKLEYLDINDTIDSVMEEITQNMKK